MYVRRGAVELPAATVSNVADYDVVVLTHLFIHPNLPQDSSLIRHCVLRVREWVCMHWPHRVAQCVMQVKANVKNYRRVVMGSDNCSGQNKNGLIIRS